MIVKNYKSYRVDTFVNKIYRGNPACVISLDKWMSDENLLHIAKENNVPETAFFINSSKKINLRWFTPDIEMDLCGHATLATAHILRTVFQHNLNNIIFHTLSGNLMVDFHDDIYYLNLPSRKAKKASLPQEIKKALNKQPKEIYKARDYLLVYNNQKEIEDIFIDKFFFDQINLGYGGVIVTAPGYEVDFVSRFFTPQATILEDPVTGSAHCTLVPFWSNRLSKKKLEAFQLSNRGGRLLCQDLSDRVLVGGQAKTLL